MQRRGVDETHVVAGVGEPLCVCAGTPADVEHPRRRGGQVTLEKLLRSLVLDPRVTLHEPIALNAGLVVRADLGVHHCRLLHVVRTLL